MIGYCVCNRHTLRCCAPGSCLQGSDWYDTAYCPGPSDDLAERPTVDAFPEIVIGEQVNHVSILRYHCASSSAFPSDSRIASD